MKASTAIVMCDAEEGMCGTWELDYYEQGASAVGGVRITENAPAPGWSSDRLTDLCPEHAAQTDGAA